MIFSRDEAGFECIDIAKSAIATDSARSEIFRDDRFGHQQDLENCLRQQKL